MKIQLLMIIAVIVSSLLTISQRAHGQEVNQFRWLEPSLEQTFDKLATPDKDHDSDSSKPNDIGSQQVAVNKLRETVLPNTIFATAARFRDSINPRAPPFSSI